MFSHPVSNDNSSNIWFHEKVVWLYLYDIVIVRVPLLIIINIIKACTYFLPTIGCQSAADSL